MHIWFVAHSGMKEREESRLKMKAEREERHRKKEQEKLVSLVSIYHLQNIFTIKMYILFVYVFVKHYSIFPG